MLPGRYLIMVVDSHPAARMLICSQLRALGHDGLTCAQDGASALTRLKVEPIDIVFMDVGSAVSGGMEALAAIRADPALHHLPVVLITTRAERETVEASLVLGVTGYLIKPPSAAAIGACLRRAFV
ncbi:MAG: response regulator [Brevundimonas sp.]|nr:response regulator [Brevundimonas sp.]